MSSLSGATPMTFERMPLCELLLSMSAKADRFERLSVAASCTSILLRRASVDSPGDIADDPVP